MCINHIEILGKRWDRVSGKEALFQAAIWQRNSGQNADFGHTTMLMEEGSRYADKSTTHSNHADWLPFLKRT